MIILGSRRTIERQAIRQLLDGMRETFPTLVPRWLAETAATNDWHNLGSHIAHALTAHLTPPPAPQPVLSFLTPPAPDPSAELRELKKQLQNTEAARQREAERARRAESQAAQSQQELRQAQHHAATQIARLQDEITRLQNEITHLRRIVGEQQFRLNQLNQPHDSPRINPRT